MSAFFDRAQSAAAHKTLQAGVGLYCATFMEGIGTDLFPVFIRAFLPVTGRKTPSLIYDCNQHGRSHSLVSFYTGIIFSPIGNFPCKLDDHLLICDLFFSGTPEGDGFDSLAAHHRACAGSTSGAPIIVFYDREGDAIFSGWANDDNPCLRVIGIFFRNGLPNPIFSLIGLRAP